MVLYDDYIEAFNTCIERLALGESIEAIMGDYPTMANELRPMLEAGNLLSRAAYPLAEVTAAQIRIEAVIRQASAGAGTVGYWPLLVIVLALGIIGFVWQTNKQAAAPTESISEESITEEASEIVPEVTPSISETPALIMIEGEVSAINVNTITIYDMAIVLEPTDPLLTVIQIGDNLRVEGEYQAGNTLILIAVEIIFIDVDVTVNEGEVWRDSGNCNNPPPPWAVANGWRRRCESGGGGGGNGNGNGRGNSGGS